MSGRPRMSTRLAMLLEDVAREAQGEGLSPKDVVAVLDEAWGDYLTDKRRWDHAEFTKILASNAR